MSKGYTNSFGEFVEDPICPYKLGNTFKHMVQQGEDEFEGYGFTVYGTVIGINEEHHYFRVRFTFEGGKSFVSCFKYPEVFNANKGYNSGGARPLGHKLSKLYKNKDENVYYTPSTWKKRFYG